VSSEDGVNVMKIIEIFTQDEFGFSAMPKKILNAKIACLDFSLQKAKMKLGVQVCVGRASSSE
jgi:hypothetical protein